ALLEVSDLQSYDLSFCLTSSANCEHFIVWCKTGHWRSSQVEGAFPLARAAALTAGVVAAYRSPGASGLIPLLGALLWASSTPASPDGGKGRISIHEQPLGDETGKNGEPEHFDDATVQGAQEDVSDEDDEDDSEYVVLEKEDAAAYHAVLA
ncbi:unnamed protein product, partial [Polarella glacialis]